MISITERLRARHEPVGDGTGRWRLDELCQESADITDSLIEALEGTMRLVDMLTVPGNRRRIPEMVFAEAALSKAKGKQE